MHTGLKVFVVFRKFVKIKNSFENTNIRMCDGARGKTLFKRIEFCYSALQPIARPFEIVCTF